MINECILYAKAFHLSLIAMIAHKLNYRTAKPAGQYAVLNNQNLFEVPEYGMQAIFINGLYKPHIPMFHLYVLSIESLNGIISQITGHAKGKHGNIFTWPYHACLANRNFPERLAPVG